MVSGEEEQEAGTGVALRRWHWSLDCKVLWLRTSQQQRSELEEPLVSSELNCPWASVTSLLPIRVMGERGAVWVLGDKDLSLFR